MKIKFHKNFEKKYIKLAPKIKSKVKERNNLFTENQFDPKLNNHALQGKYTGYRSISVTGDIRIIYKLLDNNTVIFVDIDTHSNLYK